MSEQSIVHSAPIPSLDKALRFLVAWDSEDDATDELQDAEAREVFDILQTSETRLNEAIAAAKLDGVADGGRFFTFLSKFGHRISWGAGRNSLLGLIWAGVFNRASETTKELLLAGLLTDRDFFTPLYALPGLLKGADIPPLRLAPWFIQVRSKLGNDGASGGFWGGIQSLADHHPERSLEVLEAWTEQRPSDEVTAMSVSLLGRVRSMHPGVTDAIDKRLSSHADDQLRVVYHRSWVIFDQQTPLQFDEYRNLVEKMASGTPAEIEEAFHFVRCTLPAPLRCDASFRFGIQWLHAHAPQQPDGTWAHWIISLAQSSDARSHALHLPLCRGLIAQLIPIPSNHDGTWNELESLLVKLFSGDRPAFEGLLFDIARRDRNGLAKRFSPYGGFHELPGLMLQNSPETTVANALSSLDESIRHLGLVLFDHLALDNLPHGTLNAWSDEWIGVLICQVKIGSMIGSGGCRLLRALADRASRGSEDLKAFIVEELVWQMKNLPGSCLEPVKADALKLPTDSLLHQAISAAEQYFDQLKGCYRSAINSMEVAGYRRAQRIETRKRSRQVSESAEKSSPLLSMISKSYTLYGGTQWQTFIGGNLGPPSKMQEFRHEIEFPRMFALDPDGNAQRFRGASHLMAELVNAEAKQRRSNDT